MHGLSWVGRMFIAIVAAVLLVGCSSSGTKGESSKIVESFDGTNKALASAQTQIDKTLASMDAMAAGGDLKKTHAAFASNVESLEKMASNAKKRNESMKKNVAEYIKKWQKDMEAMKDPTLAAGMTERRQAVRDNFTKVADTADGVRAAYAPFIGRLQGIEKALQIDLTPAAVQSTKPAMDAAKADSAKLKAALTAMQGELDRIKAGLSSGPAPTK